MKPVTALIVIALGAAGAWAVSSVEMAVYERMMCGCAIVAGATLIGMAWELRK
jgi:hypothetical protein